MPVHPFYPNSVGRDQADFIRMSSRWYVGFELTQHNVHRQQVPKFRDSGEVLFSWRTDSVSFCCFQSAFVVFFGQTLGSVPTFRLILQNMVVRHRCRDSPRVCPKYLVSVRCSLSAFVIFVRTDTGSSVPTFRLILQDMVVRHCCRDRPRVCPKYPMSVRDQSIVDCAEEKRRRSCQQPNKSGQEATSSAKNIALAV